MEPSRDPQSADTPEPASRPAPEPAAVPSPAGSPDKPDVVKRFLAKFLDGILAFVLFWIVSAIVPGWTLGFFLGGLVAAAYWLVSDGLDLDFMKQRSLGKKLLGLKPVRLDGQPMDLETSAKRNWMFTIGYFYNAFALSIGLSVASIISLAAFGIFVYDIYKMFTDKASNRRWGDELAGTRVVNA